MEFDLYAILQVAPHAEPEVIEAAYKRLARKYHPDLNHTPDAHDRMKALNEAYQVLSDPTERAYYDRIHASIRAGPIACKIASHAKTKAAPQDESAAVGGFSQDVRTQKNLSVSQTLIAAAIKLAKQNPVVTSELLQRRLKINYPRAVYLFAILIERGIINDQGCSTTSASQKKSTSAV